MLPGRTYRPEDILLILYRKIWFLLVPFAVVSALTAVTARRLPDVYRAEAALQVVPQRVPEEFVNPTVTISIEDRLQTIKQQITSRPRLERLIQDLNLYADERQGGIMEDIVERMRANITVTPQRGEIFRVSYTGRDARSVKAVVDRLASMFIDESLRDRAVLAEGTDQFLESQLQDAKAKLVEHERKLELYKMRFAGQLPTQLQSNLQAAQGVQAQIQSVVEARNRAQERRIMLERQFADLEALAETGDMTVEADTAVAGGAVAQRLADARRALMALEARRLTPAHPDILLQQRIIRDLEREADEEALRAPVSSSTGSPTEAARQRRLRELQATIQELEEQIARSVSDEERLRAAAAEYQRRVELAPTRESELVELTRDYGTLTNTYTGLLQKKEQANLSANLERLQIGEQFKILDPARVPERPFSPNRQRIRLMGMGVGLVIGLALIGLIEYRDSTFKTDEEISRLLALPVLAVVPVMESKTDRRRALWRRSVVGVGLGSVVLGSLAVLGYTFIR